MIEYYNNWGLMFLAAGCFGVPQLAAAFKGLIIFTLPKAQASLGISKGLA